MADRAFLELTLTGGRKAMVRIDVIAEVIERKGNSVPFQTVGSDVHLTTGRCLEVKEAPEKIKDLLLKCWAHLQGEDDEGG